MISTNKPMPVASLPDNWSAFNGHEVLPWDIPRAEAAATLRRARSLRTRGQATVSIEAIGRYRLSTAFALAKYIRDNQHHKVDTPMWGSVVWSGFAFALAEQPSL